MTKSINAPLLTAMGQETTTLATCWKVTRLDGQVFGFTDHPSPLEVSGIVYEAESGYTATNIVTSSKLDVDNLEVSACLSSSAITDEDVAAGLWDFATVEIFRVDYTNIAAGVDQLRKGWTGEIRTGQVEFFTELRGMTQALQQETGRLYIPSCDADFCDSRCGLSIATYTVTGTLTSVTSTREFADSSRSEADGYFAGGKLTWTGGLNTGLAMEVKGFTNSGGAFELHEHMPYAVQVGDTYSVYAGCQKTKAACTAFSNVVNFRGFDKIPGSDRLVSGQ